MSIIQVLAHEVGGYEIVTGRDSQVDCVATWYHAAAVILVVTVECRPPKYAHVKFAIPISVEDHELMVWVGEKPDKILLADPDCFRSLATIIRIWRSKRIADARMLTNDRGGL